METYCPECGEKYGADETTCPNCEVALLELPADEATLPDAELVPVFSTTEAALIPLVQVTLSEAGIEHTVWNRGLERIMGARTSMSVGETDAPLLVLVRAEDEGQARERLADLAVPGVPVAPSAPAHSPRPTPTESGSTVALVDEETGRPIGEISSAQFAGLAAQLERESEDDDDYYIDEATLTLLEDKGADAGVIALLRHALGSRSGMDVRWTRR